MRSIDTCIIVMLLQAEGVCVFTVKKKKHFKFLPFIVVCLQFGGMFKGT